VERRSEGWRLEAALKLGMSGLPQRSRARGLGGLGYLDDSSFEEEVASC